MNERNQMVKHKRHQPMVQMMNPLMRQLINPQTLNQPQMMPVKNGSYRMWPQSINPALEQLVVCPNPFTGGRSNWKGKQGMMNGQNNLMIRRNDKQQIPHNQVFTNVGEVGYQPPGLLELQSQNRNKLRKYYHPKNKFNKRFAPYAPRNTSSFIIRAKKSGGIASVVSPCPVTPAVLPTPVFSPSREVLGDIAKEEWGVDGYGSMKGLIRLRSPASDGDEEEGVSSGSDVEDHVEVERRLDHDLSRFEMIYPNNAGSDYNNLLENRVDDQDTHIAQLEEENLTLKERLFMMERKMGDLRKRLQCLERLARVQGYAEEVVENGLDNDVQSIGRDVEQQSGVGCNEELEYVNEHRSAERSYQEENVKAEEQAVLENENGLNPNNPIDFHDDNIEMKVESDINMEEFIATPERNSANKIMEQTLDVRDINEEVTKYEIVKKLNCDAVGAECSESEERKG